ncbi:glycosyltransferase [Variovorax sp. YR752]|uniref:glycosyltransferase n=1 Tax=Variovorax sp. YR752 TaxID=1884383 RepID=UPI003137BAF7
MIDIVSATRCSEAEFWADSALGQSLQRLQFDGRLRPRVSFENRRGLSEVYNSALTAPDANDMLVFVHDDVWLEDFFLADRVAQGLRAFDVIGLAGNRRQSEQHVSWNYIGTDLVWDDLAHLSGIIAHGQKPFSRIDCFGTVPADCELLDGVFLAANRRTLLAKAVAFDPQFDFHFYDIDFCRTARRQGLRLGTWPISVKHQSGGAFGSAEWARLYPLYAHKWGGAGAPSLEPNDRP